MRNAFEPWHVVVLLVVLFGLFGYKKLPDAARSIGRSMRIFKAETKGLRGGDSADDKALDDGSAVTGATPTRAADPEKV